MQSEAPQRLFCCQHGGSLGFGHLVLMEVSDPQRQFVESSGQSNSSYQCPWVPHAFLRPLGIMRSHVSSFCSFRGSLLSLYFSLHFSLFILFFLLFLLWHTGAWKMMLFTSQFCYLLPCSLAGVASPPDWALLGAPGRKRRET